MVWELRPEFAKEVQETLEKGKFIEVKDFEKEYGLK